MHMRYACEKKLLSRGSDLYLRRRSLSELQKPIVFMEAATAFANANTIPTDAPNSGPNERLII